MPGQEPKAHAVGGKHQLSPQEQEERKQRVLTHGAPAVVRSIADAVVVKDGNLFFLTEPDGRVPLRRRLAALPLAGCLAAVLSVLLGARAVYVAAAFGMDARNGWRIAEMLLLAALAIVAWRRWKRRRS